MMNNFRSIIKGVENGVVAVAGVVILFLIASILLPKFNYHLFVVQSGSMTPTIGLGSVVITRSQSEYDRGNIITFWRSEKSIVTHRIIDSSERDGRIFYKTKGDANESEDMFLVEKSRVFGEVVINIPFLGYLIAFAKTKLGVFLLILIPAAWIIIEEVLKIKKALKEKKNLENKEENEEKNA